MKRLIAVAVATVLLVGCGGKSNSKPNQCKAGTAWNPKQGKCVTAPDSGGKPLTPLIPSKPTPPTKPTPPVEPAEHCSTKNKYHDWHKDTSSVEKYYSTMTVNNCNNVVHSAVSIPKEGIDPNESNGYELQYFSDVTEYSEEGHPRIFDGHAVFSTHRQAIYNDGAETWPMSMFVVVEHAPVPESARILGATECSYRASLQFTALVIQGKFERFRNKKRGGTGRLECKDRSGSLVVDISGMLVFTEQGEFDVNHPSYDEQTAQLWSDYGFHAFHEKFEEANRFAAPVKEE
ncbi:hypothetical protein VIN01S_02220 [Vibrio inusitatus NBRC 102082]|uniref:Lipoprotein n=1 Tax=Vibrio inusitatus NBRC 102082 TaxID=1219070 RepID=A0A4Y3HQU4_9VIBR|nr:hypothetical protein [Vibrio inusitatus]GEA49418.1 hypothetical protein VIN01S_02220 [Vibrio inusitatus NBRC 102082]